jgi:hypothetical protein
MMFVVGCDNGGGDGSILPPSDSTILNSVSEALGNYVGKAQKPVFSITNVGMKNPELELCPNTGRQILRVKEVGNGRIEGELMTPDGLYFYGGSLNLQDGVFNLTAENDPDATMTGIIQPETKCISGHYTYEVEGESRNGNFKLCQDDTSISNVYCFSETKDSGGENSFQVGLMVFDEKGLAHSGRTIWASKDEKTEEVVWLEGQFDGHVLSLQNDAISLQ